MSLETKRECVGNMSLGYLGVQVWSTETADGYGEGQVEMCRADGLGAVKDGREADQGARGLTVGG